MQKDLRACQETSINDRNDEASMLVTFRSKASADVVMFGDVAVRLIKLMGHSGVVPSAIFAEDVGAALCHLKQAVEAEVADFLHRHADLKTEAGRRRVVRHGHLPEREIMTGIGPVAVSLDQIARRAGHCPQLYLLK